MATYMIRVEGAPAFPCPDHRPILFAAWEHGVHLPYGCRAGGCGRCLAGVLQGRVDRSRQRLGNPPLAQLCLAYPLSDCTLALSSGALSRLPVSA
ncbi:MAG: 2Fe-2S iron-sulfur cluster-binding protein [Synechococcaceae cyanobacterium]|nr:2Fe-2S iron-sulfur cluster-binding protein [Synechococcaceae cyanobacterium]